jgi:hypothetical protein
MSGTTDRPRRSRRRPAAASRILVTGLSLSATLGLLAAIDPAPEPAAAGTAATVAPASVAPDPTLGRRAATPGRAAGRRSDRRPAPVTRSHASR